MNNWQLVGRIADEPTIFTLIHGRICVQVFVEVKAKDNNCERIDCIECSFFGMHAEALKHVMEKGQPLTGTLISVEGEGRNGSFRDKEHGIRIYTTKCFVKEFTLFPNDQIKNYQRKTKKYETDTNFLREVSDGLDTE